MGSEGGRSQNVTGHRCCFCYRRTKRGKSASERKAVAVCLSPCKPESSIGLSFRYPVNDGASGVRGFSSRSYFSVNADSAAIWTTRFLSDHDLFQFNPAHRSPDPKPSSICRSRQAKPDAVICMALRGVGSYGVQDLLVAAQNALPVLRSRHLDD